MLPCCEVAHSTAPASAAGLLAQSNPECGCTHESHTVYFQNIAYYFNIVHRPAPSQATFDGGSWPANMAAAFVMNLSDGAAAAAAIDQFTDADTSREDRTEALLLLAGGWAGRRFFFLPLEAMQQQAVNSKHRVCCSCPKLTHPPSPPPPPNAATQPRPAACGAGARCQGAAGRPPARRRRGRPVVLSVLLAG